MTCFLFYVYLVKLLIFQLTADIAHQAGFKPERKTVIASHGWQSGADTFDPLAKTYLANPQLSEINVRENSSINVMIDFCVFNGKFFSSSLMKFQLPYECNFLDVFVNFLACFRFSPWTGRCCLTTLLTWWPPPTSQL